MCEKKIKSINYKGVDVQIITEKCSILTQLTVIGKRECYTSFGPNPDPEKVKKITKQFIKDAV